MSWADTITKVLPPITSFILLILVFAQYRLQKNDQVVDLSVTRATHYQTAINEAKPQISDNESELLLRSDPSPPPNEDEIIFEVENVGQSTAKRVHVESELIVLYPESKGDSVSTNEESSEENYETVLDDGSISLPPMEEWQRRVRVLDLIREDVRYGGWHGPHSGEISGNVDRVSFVVETVARIDGEHDYGISELLSCINNRSIGLRLRLRLRYTSRLAFRAKSRQILDLVIFPHVADDLQEGLETGVSYEEYQRLNHEEIRSDVFADAKI